MKCKGCGKQVHRSAKTCPHCGVSKPGVNAAHGCFGIIALAIVFIVIVAANDDRKPQAEKTPAELRQDQIIKQFSPFSGEHLSLSRYIKANMKNPDSYEHIKTVYVDNGDYLTVETLYRGTNGFGGVVPGVVKAKADLKGDLLEILP